MAIAMKWMLLLVVIAVLIWTSIYLALKADKFFFDGYFANKIKTFFDG